MPFSSMDDLVSEITSGKFNRNDWNKITGGAAYTAGRWYDFSGLGGTPVANAFAGTALAWTTGLLLAIRLLMLLALRGSYARPGPGFWLSPLADLAAWVRIALSMARPPTRWRTRTYDS